METRPLQGICWWINQPNENSAACRRRFIGGCKWRNPNKGLKRTHAYPQTLPFNLKHSFYLQRFCSQNASACRAEQAYTLPKTTCRRMHAAVFMCLVKSNLMDFCVVKKYTMLCTFTENNGFIASCSTQTASCIWQKFHCTTCETRLMKWWLEIT